MRFMMLAVAALAVALISCNGGQPRLYKVAIDPSPLNNLATTCWNTGNVPVDTTTLTNGFLDYEWTIWDGAADKQYLALTQTTFALGNANPVRVCTGNADSLPCLIEGGAKSFSSSRVFTRNSVNPVETDTRTLTITFDDTPGETAKGTLNVKSLYACSGSCNKTSCEVTLPFVARRVDAQANTNYQGP